MKLSRLIENINIVERKDFRDVEITGITPDSNEVNPGYIFVAVKGTRADGHDFAGHALERGASALVVEKRVESGRPQLVVNDTSLVLALIAKKFYGHQDEKLRLAGITGTNGKTSTSFLLRSIMEHSGVRTGIMGTVGYGSDKQLNHSTYTTPGAVELYRTLAEFEQRGVENVVMEVSSHALAQSRVGGLQFDIAIFTNITRDHLDYHGTFEEYVEAKAKLISALKGGEHEGVLIYNRDDSYVSMLAGRFRGKRVSFGLSDQADVRAGGIKAGMEGTHFDIVAGGDITHVDMKLLGEFSIYNALAAAAAAGCMGIEKENIKRGIERVGSVPGRFQVITAPGAPRVIVDYAHTPDALKNLLNFCSRLGAERIITVFGCGGDRDRGKRPLMGKIAGEYSDLVLVTSDNPRTENPLAIIKDVVEGVEQSGTDCRILENRREAIREGVMEGREDELVIIAGKGHECVQILRDTRIPFSDVEEARKAIERRRISSE